MHPIPLPDHLTDAEVLALNPDDLAAMHPEEAMVAADFALKRQVNNSRHMWAMMARIVHYVYTNDIWKYHPEGYSSFNAWCQQPEIELPPSVLSDMLAICNYAPRILKETGVDLFETIERVGQSKVRQIVPLIRHSVATGDFEDIQNILDELETSSFREILKMLSPKGRRQQFDPEVIYQENPDGTVNLILRNLDLDAVELASNRLSIRRWFNEDGYRIPNPLDHKEGEEPDTVPDAVPDNLRHLPAGDEPDNVRHLFPEPAARSA